MPFHYPDHLIMGVAAIAATLLVISLTHNDLVRRKLRLSLYLFAAYLLFNLVVWQKPDLPGLEGDLLALERLVFAAALINLVVYLFIGETRPARAAATATASGGAGPNPLTDGVYMQVVLATFAFCLMFFSHISVMPLTVTISAGYPAVVYGVLLGTNGLLIALFEISVVGALRPFRRLRVAALGMALAGVGLGAKVPSDSIG